MASCNVASRVRTTFQIELPLPLLFAVTRLDELALAIEEILIAEIEALGAAEADALLNGQPAVV